MQEIKFNIGELSTGIYICRLQIDGHVINKKILFLRNDRKGIGWDFGLLGCGGCYSSSMDMGDILSADLSLRSQNVTLEICILPVLAVTYNVPENV